MLEEPLPVSEEIHKTNGDEEWEGVESDNNESENEENNAVIDRVLKKYGKVQVDEGGGLDAQYNQFVKEKMDEWKKGYYKGKLKISCDDPKDTSNLTFKYVE
ncbi:hypothetical protein PILCRDRAFT_91509 [Piloderma croceum F 1598]|uniref:Uncharacterized protein n=1 Tax=Piloderma croceum (strain F 1598) TaxID=765440 RepID=A0A0C3FA32_PILCF|nr:hypothetical protein PILCRDRAFT_91509 [Piloderma croceum F 1598]